MLQQVGALGIPQVWEQLKGNATDVISTASSLLQQVGAANQHLETVSVRAQLAAR